MPVLRAEILPFASKGSHTLGSTLLGKSQAVATVTHDAFCVEQKFIAFCRATSNEEPAELYQLVPLGGDATDKQEFSNASGLPTAMHPFI